MTSRALAEIARDKLAALARELAGEKRARPPSRPRTAEVIRHEIEANRRVLTDPRNRAAKFYEARIHHLEDELENLIGATVVD